MLLTPGTAVTPELKLASKLGEGSMGSIWAAQHLGRGQNVAVKFVSAGLADENPQAFDRFQREAEVLDGFTHPHVVELLGRGQTPDGMPYIVMELLAGEPLVDYLEREGVLTVEEMTRLVEQLGAALEALHARGIVHRDVKAENIFVRGEEEDLTIKLYDFGLAKKPGEDGHKKQLTGLGMMVGTAEYMSPEQIVSARDVDHHADLWALAVVSYVSFVGGLPFGGGDVTETFAQIRSAQFERPTTIREDANHAIDRWFERAFFMDRKHRFKTAREMMTAWRQALAGIEPEPNATAVPAAAPSPAALQPPVDPRVSGGQQPLQGTPSPALGAPPSPGAGPPSAPLSELDDAPSSPRGAIIAAVVVASVAIGALIMWLIA